MTAEYLNSCDYIAAYLADCCKDSPGGSNHFVLELELSRPAELAWLTVHIRQRVGLLPHLTGQMHRKLFTLSPYWKWENGRKSRIEILQGSQEMAQDYINEPLRTETYFGVLICGSTLYFKFSHLIFDGVGAERFLQWLFSDAPPPSNPGLLTSSHLNEWKKQMECGRKFRELFLPENDNEVAALCGKEDSETGLISRTWEFSQIAAEAEKEAGPFMMIPFLVSECVEALDPFLPKTGDVVVPVMVDQRGQEDQAADSMLFNHWSLQPLLLPEPARKVEKERIAALKHSFFESSAQRAAYLFRHAAFSVRFVPFRLMRYLEQKYGACLGGTFLFSYMDNSVLEQQYIGQSKVLNVRHYPVMPPRPGIGFVFTRFGNDLHLTVSYRKNILPNGELLESNLETLFKHGVKDDI